MSSSEEKRDNEEKRLETQKKIWIGVGFAVLVLVLMAIFKHLGSFQKLDESSNADPFNPSGL